MRTAASKANANLPFGIAWNLCQMSWQAELKIVEMAIGKMGVNAALVQPDIAIVTNIAPAHLIHHRDTETIARRKAAIFTGVGDGGWAVICRDSKHFDLLHQAAQAELLNILSYGEHEEADIRLQTFDPLSGAIVARLNGDSFEYSLAAASRHMAVNSLSCLAVAKILHLDLQQLRPGFANFTPPAGRGHLMEVELDGKQLLVVDETYNANPASMHAALGMFAELPSPPGKQRRLLILGDMLELGEESERYHRELLGAIVATKADHVFLVGEWMSTLQHALERENLKASTHSSAEALWIALTPLLADGDRLLLKASNGIGLHRLVKKMMP